MVVDELLYDELEKLYFCHERWERDIPLKIYIKYFLLYKNTVMQLDYTCWTRCKQYQLFINKENVLSPKQHNVELVRNEKNFAAENSSVNK